MNRRFMITGGAGFIGSAVVRHLIETSAHEVCVVDKLTYAGNLDNLAGVAGDPRYRFKQADICDARAMRQICENFSPEIIMHLAAESHVDRSIDGPGAFIETNVVGTFRAVAKRRGLLARAAVAQDRRGFASTISRPTKCFGSLGPNGLFHRSDALRSAFALFRFEGLVRSSGPRVASHLRPAGRS